MQNAPIVKLGLVAVSRSCFSKSLSTNRRNQTYEYCVKNKTDIYNCPVLVENENDAMEALKDIKNNECNALVVFLGNFGPETPETILAQRFDGPVMFVCSAEDSKKDLFDGRGDAYCGMLNASYNLGLRKIKAYIPDYPVGTPEEIADKIAKFVPIARVILGVKNLKIISFGPRPQDFLACNAPIKCLYDLGVEIQENSELDLLQAFEAHKDDPRIPDLVEDMKNDTCGCCYPEILPNLAQYELTLLDWANANKGASKYVAFTTKCWPAFESYFGFVPCYINGHLASKGYPVSCEVDIYGALTEYILALATEFTPALLDINNSVPKDLYDAYKSNAKDYNLDDMFMGFHCGNGSSCFLCKPEIKYHRIMKRDLEPDSEPNLTRGTMEGDLMASPVTLFRLQSTASSELRAYIAEGESLDIPTHSFGTIGVIAIPEMARFYRHVLIEKNFPHHAGVGFAHCGKILFEVMKLLGVTDIGFNRKKSDLYPTENPFSY